MRGSRDRLRPAWQRPGDGAAACDETGHLACRRARCRFWDPPND